MQTRSFLLAIVLAMAAVARADELRLDELDLSRADQGFGEPQKNLSVEKKPLTIGGKKYDHGFGTHANSHLALAVNGATHFSADVGIDDETKGKGSVIFQVIGDKKVLFDSGKMQPGAVMPVNIDLTGVKKIDLRVGDAGDGVQFDHADWGNAIFAYSGEKPGIFEMPRVKPYILTPKPSAEPRINGAKVYGVRPGHPFMYTIAATGDRPMKFEAHGNTIADPLPDGLKFDSETGQITGVMNSPGEYVIHLVAENAKGKIASPLRVIVGNTISLTPALGWNSWNCWAAAVDDAKVRAAADAMVSSGLINHGWTYINIDDCWEIKPGSKEPMLSGPEREANGMIRTNKKFPDMKALADYVHSKGLKIGIYSSPGPTTCGGYTASYQHELDDAKQYAAWGFDYLKYDWCSYGMIAAKITEQKYSEAMPDQQEKIKALSDEKAALLGKKPRDKKRISAIDKELNTISESLGDKKKQIDLEIAQHPYAVMRHALDQVDRDIVFSFCQYGMKDVWEWGTQLGGNSWRTTGDIRDTWDSMAGIGFNQDGHEKFITPGHWNDPDMLVVGKVGWGPSLHPTRLTPDEQYTHISLWCLLSSPLLIGCDMSEMDEFTISLLSNDEVLAVNQDPLGKPAGRVSKHENAEVWARDLEDGSKAVGLFNRDDEPMEVTAKFSDLKLEGSHMVRDLWRQKNLGKSDGEFKTMVPAHGVVLVKIK